jgi:ribosomal protein L11 methyltransferase
MAFGTGTHETTQTVIGMLEGLDVASPVLDWGTGSGILAIAAGKLGCGPVLACDIDPDAAFVAQSNFRRNRVAARLFVGSVDAVGSASIGLVLANLTPDVIGEGLEDLVRVLGPGGQAVLSGILADHTAPLETSLARAGLPIVSRVDRGEWISYLVSACGD